MKIGVTVTVPKPIYDIYAKAAATIDNYTVADVSFLQQIKATPCISSATCCGISSTRSVVSHQAAKDTPSVMIYACGDGIHANA